MQVKLPVLAADFGRLKNELETVKIAGADLLLIDFMDGHFVPKLVLVYL